MSSSALSVSPCLFVCLSVCLSLSLSHTHTHAHTLGVECPFYEQEIILLTCLIRSAWQSWQKLENWNPLLAWIVGDFVACWATGPLIGNFSEDDFGMVNGYDLAAAGPRCHGPFLFCSWHCHLCLRDWATSKAAWLYSNGAVAATVKCLRKLT